MITHEEARKELKNGKLIGVDSVVNTKLFYNYITQQEAQSKRLKKVDELLGLYRERLSAVYVTEEQLDRFHELDLQIEALEEELK